MKNIFSKIRRVYSFRREVQLLLELKGKGLDDHVPSTREADGMLAVIKMIPN